MQRLEEIRRDTMPRAGLEQGRRLCRVGKFTRGARLLGEPAGEPCASPTDVPRHEGQRESGFVVVADTLERLVAAEPEDLPIAGDVTGLAEQVRTEYLA